MGDMLAVVPPYPLKLLILLKKSSDPSKTADIEQSLVIGAHGPKSLLVIVLRK